jgi:hypothetical protein
VELEKLHKDVNIGTFIKAQRLRWMKHYSTWMMQETPRKYNKSTCTKDDVKGDRRLDGKMMQRMTREI